MKSYGAQTTVSAAPQTQELSDTSKVRGGGRHPALIACCRMGATVKTLTLLLSLGLLLGGAKSHAQRAGGEPLNLAPAQAASLKLRAAGFRYVGAEASAGDVCVHEEPVMLDGRSYNWSDAQMDGLFAEDGRRGVSKVYQPYDLASKAGWYKGEGEPEPNNNIWGLFVSGGKVWMGTNGLGVLAFDPVREEWTRYDWQTEAVPGTRTYLEPVPKLEGGR